MPSSSPTTARHQTSLDSFVSSSWTSQRTSIVWPRGGGHAHVSWRASSTTTVGVDHGVEGLVHEVGLLVFLVGKLCRDGRPLIIGLLDPNDLARALARRVVVDEGQADVAGLEVLARGGVLRVRRSVLRGVRRSGGAPRS